MSISKLPSGRYRAQVHDPVVGHNVSVSKVLGGPGTFATKREAKAAREAARARVGRQRSTVTVADFRKRWLNDPLFVRPKDSTMLHNAERTKAFADRYGRLPIDRVDDQVVAEWLAGGRHNGSVPALRAMFNDARSAKAGRLIEINPFAGLGIARTRGNRDRQPPTLEKMEQLVALAWQWTPPSFAAYLEFACCTAIRPGELDALRPDAIDYEAGEIHVRDQWNAKTQTFTAPKYGPYTVALVERAADVLGRTPRRPGDEFIFTTLRGTHYTPSSRVHHWNRVRSAAGLGGMTLYLATRHFAGTYMTNVLGLPPHVVAEQLGHKDGGKLVTLLYGHPDKARARRLIREAYDAHGQARTGAASNGQTAETAHETAHGTLGGAL
jgi:integrase